MNIGIFSIQGDVEENIISTKEALKKMGISGQVKEVKTPSEIENIDGIIIPGGESTTIGQLSLVNASLKTVQKKIKEGMPAFGICAGLILLSKNVSDRIKGKTDQPVLELLDVTIERNSFGHQSDSFETELDLNSIDIPKFNGVFIRAPSILKTGDGVETLATLDEKIVAVKNGNILATAFHPELTNDSSLHEHFVKMIQN